MPSQLPCRLSSLRPASEQAVDFLHKGVYALVTGLVADRLVAPALQSARGLTSH